MCVYVAPPSPVLNGDSSPPSPPARNSVIAEDKSPKKEEETTNNNGIEKEKTDKKVEELYDIPVGKFLSTHWVFGTRFC